MSYLYGDSTESGLELNYIELLREFLDFAAQLLMSESRIARQLEQVDDNRKRAEEELQRLKKLSEVVEETLKQARGPEGSASNRCAASIQSTAIDAIKHAAADLKASVAEEQRSAAGRTLRERSGNEKLLERLLLSHPLPDCTERVELSLREAGYAATVHGRSPQGLEWAMAADIPGDHTLAQPIKVSALADGLEIQLPEKSGLVRKSMKLRAHRIDGYTVVELSNPPGSTTLKLRANPPHDQSGLDVEVFGDPRRVRLVRVGKSGDVAASFEPLDEDGHALLGLADKVERLTLTLAGHKSSLLEARLDGGPLRDHKDPSVVVQRLVERMAPVIHEISRRSLTADELVLKRIVAGDRREEIFASKADLLAKLTPVPESLRGVFAPLGLGNLDPHGDDDATNELVVASTRGASSNVVRSGSIRTPSSEIDDDDDDETNVTSSSPRPPLSDAQAPSRTSATMAEDSGEILVAGDLATSPTMPPVPPVPAKRAPAAPKLRPPIPPIIPEKTVPDAKRPKPDDGRKPQTPTDPDSIDVALAELEAESD